MSDRAARTAERLLVVLACAYVLVFAFLQRSGIGDPRVLEWDARNMLLPAWRYHSTGLFPRDLTVELMAAFATPGWKAVYWVGTLFADPPLLSRLLPFIGLAVVAWQGWSFGKHHGGRALGAATVILLVHCTMIWNRMAGGHARAFAYPLVIAFLRYASTGASHRALLVLLLSAIFYPSVFVLLAPAYAMTLVRAPRKEWLRFGAVALACVVLLAIQARPDPRFGSAPSLAEAATLAQMGPGGAQPFFPLPSAWESMRQALAIAFHPDGDFWRGVPHATTVMGVAAIAILIAGGRALPPALFAFALSTLFAFALATLLAYRLYLPDRMLVFGWPPLVLMALPLALFHRLRERGALAMVVLVFAVCGDGLARNENLTQFGDHDTPVIRFAATLPQDAVIATHPERGTYVQTFAHRNVLFSSATNIPWFLEYAHEMERRIGDFYRAYYARSPDEITRFAQKYRVDYLIGDARDFGENARERARYYKPWDELTARLLEGGGDFALANPPENAIVFRDGARFVVDLRLFSAR